MSEPRYPIEAIDTVVAYAKQLDDGCSASSLEYLEGSPQAVVLVATAANPERLALLEALHTCWYPRDDE